MSLECFVEVGWVHTDIVVVSKHEAVRLIVFTYSMFSLQSLTVSRSVVFYAQLYPLFHGYCTSVLVNCCLPFACGNPAQFLLLIFILLLHNSIYTKFYNLIPSFTLRMLFHLLTT